MVIKYRIQIFAFDNVLLLLGGSCLNQVLLLFAGARIMSRHANVSL